MLRVQASQTAVFSAKLESTVSSVTGEAREYHVTVGQSIPGPILSALVILVPDTGWQESIREFEIIHEFLG